MKQIPIVIDCDPGYDDIVALMMAHASDKVELLAITPVVGNVAYKYTSKNAATIAGYIGSKARVTKGSETPLEFVPEKFGEKFHGTNGLLDIEIDNRTGVELEDNYAWDVMYELALKYSGELVICPIGPLTNIAKMIQKYPDVVDHIKRLQIMGGNDKMPGFNEGSLAEYNIYIDPHACDIVLRSGIPITMCGLDCTRPGSITIRELRDTCGGDSSVSEFMNGYVEFDLAMGDTLDNTTTTIHDAIAIGVVIDPTLFETKKAYVKCITEGDEMGRTVVDFDSKTPNVDFAMGADPKKFLNLLEDMMKKYR